MSTDPLFVVRVGSMLTAWDCTYEEAIRFAKEDIVGIVEPQDDIEVTEYEESLPPRSTHGSLYSRIGYSPTLIGFKAYFGFDPMSSQT